LRCFSDVTIEWSSFVFETHAQSLKGKQVCSHYTSDVVSALVRKLRVQHIRHGATVSLTVFRFLNDVMLRGLWRMPFELSDLDIAMTRDVSRLAIAVLGARPYEELTITVTPTSKVC